MHFKMLITFIKQNNLEIWNVTQISPFGLVHIFQLQLLKYVNLNRNHNSLKGPNIILLLYI